MRKLLAVTAMLLWGTQTGCLSFSSLFSRQSPQLDTSLLERQGYSVPPGGMPTPMEPDRTGKPNIVMELRIGGQQPHLERIPLPDEGGAFIEDFVRQTRLHEQLGQLNISIMRPNPHGGPPVRLEVRTDDDGRVANLATNYALMPGDHLVIIEDQRSYLERFVESQFKM